MEGHVYIIGQIGSDEKTKGVEIQDVVSKVEAMADFDNIFVHIDSMGGFVHVGDAIHDYLSTKTNVSTIAENVCMSIATKIHLSVPKEKRFVVEGTKYLTHNPLLTNVSGNADELIKMAEELKPVQNELVKMYVSKTGLSKEAVEGLMNQESFISEEQLIEMNFASKILPKNELKAVAFYNKEEKTKNENFMSKFKVQALQMFAKAMNVDLKEIIKDENDGREAVALMIETENGTLETPFSDLMVGDPVLIDGVQAPAGTYVSTADGMTIVIDEMGMISEIIPAVEDDVEALKTEIENLKAQNESLIAEKEVLNVKVSEMETEQKEVLETIQNFKQVKSVFVPKVGKTIINSKGKDEVLSVKERIAKRKAEAKAKA